MNKFEELPKNVREVIGLAYDLSVHCAFDTIKNSIAQRISRQLEFAIESYWPEYFTASIEIMRAGQIVKTEKTKKVKE